MLQTVAGFVVLIIEMQGVRALLTRGLSYNNYRIIMLDSIAFLVSPVLTNLTSQLVCQRVLY